MPTSQARPGFVALPPSSTPWPLPGPCPAASPAQPSGAGRLGGLQGRPSATWSNHLVGRGGNWVRARGPHCSGPCPWSGCSPMASLPWPRCAPGAWCGHQRGAQEGSRSGVGPSRGTGGASVWLCPWALGTCSRLRGVVSQRMELGVRSQSPSHPPWQTPRTDFSKAGGQVASPRWGRGQQRSGAHETPKWTWATGQPPEVRAGPADGA